MRVVLIDATQSELDPAAGAGASERKTYVIDVADVPRQGDLVCISVDGSERTLQVKRMRWLATVIDASGDPENQRRSAAEIICEAVLAGPNFQWYIGP